MRPRVRKHRYESLRDDWGDMIDDRDGVRIMHALLRAGFTSRAAAGRARVCDLLAVRGIGVKSLPRIKQTTSLNQQPETTGKPRK